MKQAVKLIALLMIFLIADIPFVIAAFDAQGNYYVGEGEDQAYSDYYDGLQEEAPEEQNIVRESPQACADKHAETSSVAGVLDNSLIGKFAKVITMLHTICVALNSINSVLSILDSVMGGRPPASGWCCFAGLSYIPIIGYVLSAICNVYHSFYVGWENFFRPIGGNFCCLINCNYCKGANCFEKAKTEAERLDEEADYKEGMAKVADVRGDTEQAEARRKEGAELKTKAEASRKAQADKDKPLSKSSISGYSEKFFGPDSYTSKGAYLVSGQWVASNKLYNSDGSPGPVPAGLRAMKAGTSEGSLTSSFVDILGASIDPYSDIYTASACFCLPGILYNLRKLKVIYDTHACCVEKACENGISTESCDKMLSEMKCMYWEGSLWSALAKIVTAVAVAAIKNAIIRVLGERLVAALSCVIALWDLKNAPAMLGSLSDITDDPLDVHCEELDFGAVSDEEGLLKSAEVRSMSYGAEIANLSSFSPEDRDGNGIIDSVQFSSSAGASHNTGDLYFNKQGILVEYDGAKETAVTGDYSGKKLSFGGKSYDLSGYTKDGVKYSKTGASDIYVAPNYFGTETTEGEKKVYTQYSSEGTLTIDKSKNEWTLKYPSGSEEKTMQFTNSNIPTNEQARLLLIGASAGATDNELKDATFTGTGQEMRIGDFTFTEGTVSYTTTTTTTTNKFPVSLYSKIKDRKLEYSQGIYASGLGLFVSQKNDYFLVNDNGARYAISADGRTKVELSEQWYSRLSLDANTVSSGEENLKISDLSRVVSFVGAEPKFEGKAIKNGVAENEHGYRKANIDEGSVILTSVDSTEGWGRYAMFGTADYVKTVRDSKDGVTSVNEFFYSSQGMIDKEPYLSNVALIEGSSIVVTVSKKPRIGELFIKGSITVYTKDKITYKSDGNNEYSLSSVAGRPDLFEVQQNGHTFYLAQGEGTFLTGVIMYKKEGDNYVPVDYEKDTVGLDKTGAAEMLSSVTFAVQTAARIARAEGIPFVLSEQQKYLVRVSALTKQAANEAAYRLASFLVEKTIGRAIEKKIQKRCEENWDASEPVSDAPEDTRSTGNTLPELTNCHGELATIASAEILHKYKYLDNSFKYDYSFSVTNCNADVNYAVYLRSSSGRQDIASGSAPIGSVIARNNLFSSQGDYSEVCVDTSATNGLCVPFRGVLEFIGEASESPSAPVVEEEARCEFGFSSEVSHVNDVYTGAYAITVCEPTAFSLGFANNNQFERSSVVSRFLSPGTREDFVSFASNNFFSQFCIERSVDGRSVLLCNQFDEAPVFTPPEGVTYFTAIAAKGADSYDIKADIYPNNGAVDYTLFLKEGSVKQVVEEGIAREEKHINLAVNSRQEFSEVCLATLADLSFGENGVQCYPVN